MACNLFIISKRRPLRPDRIFEIQDHAVRAYSLFGHISGQREISSDGRVAAMFLSRNGQRVVGPASAFACGAAGSVLGWAGYWYDGMSTSPEDLLLRLEESEEPAKVIERLAGTFNIFFYDGRRRVFWSWNTLSCFPPIYWYESDEEIAISNRQDLLLGLYSARSRGYRIAAIASFLLTDHFTCGYPGPEDISTLGPSHELRVDLCHEVPRSVTRMYCVDWEAFGRGDRELKSGDFDELAHQLLCSARAAAGGRTVTLGLSGGKDSRLVLSALHAAGVDFVAHTSGWEDHPDMIVAQQVAARLGVPLNRSITRPGSATRIERFDVGRGFARSIARYDGQNLSRPTYPVQVAESIQEKRPPAGTCAAFSGTGGELLRGGFALKELGWANNLDSSSTPLEVAAAARKRLSRVGALLRRDAVTAFHSEMDDFLSESIVPLNPLGLLERCYLFTLFRTRFAPSCDPESALPLADVSLLRIASKASTSFLSSELIFFEIIRRLAPAIADVPLARYRWSFEADHPDASRQAGWENRYAVPMVWGSRMANYPYFMAGTEFLGAFREELLSAKSREVLDPFIEVDLLGKVLDGPARFQEQVSWFLWNVLASSMLLRGTWLEWRDQPERNVDARLDVAWHRLSLDLCQLCSQLTQSTGQINSDARSATAEVLRSELASAVDRAWRPKVTEDVLLPTLPESAEFLSGKSSDLSLPGGVSLSVGLQGAAAVCSVRRLESPVGAIAFDITHAGSPERASWLVAKGKFGERHVGQKVVLRAELQATAPLNVTSYARAAGESELQRSDFKLSIKPIPIKVVVGHLIDDTSFEVFLPAGLRGIGVRYLNLRVGFEDQDSSNGLLPVATSFAEAWVEFLRGVLQLGSRYEVSEAEMGAFLRRIDCFGDENMTLADLLKSPERIAEGLEGCRDAGDQMAPSEIADRIRALACRVAEAVKVALQISSFDADWSKSP